MAFEAYRQNPSSIRMDHLDPNSDLDLDGDLNPRPIVNGSEHYFVFIILKYISLIN